MPKLLRCKACGFIIREDKLGTKCPACGAPRAAFEPYEEKIDPKRKKILDMHLHPVIVHFPQAFSVLILFLTGIGLIFPSFLRTQFLCTIHILAILLPIVVLPTISSGILDGKTRFKKVSTPYLKKKIIFGTIFLVLSTILAFISVFLTNEELFLIYTLILSLGCVLCGLILGLIGGSLLESKLPN